MLESGVFFVLLYFYKFSIGNIYIEILNGFDKLI